MPRYSHDNSERGIHLYGMQRDIFLKRLETIRAHAFRGRLLEGYKAEFVEKMELIKDSFPFYAPEPLEANDPRRARGPSITVAQMNFLGSIVQDLNQQYGLPGDFER